MLINNISISRQLFGSELKTRILWYLYSQVQVTERELARILGVSHTAVNKAMKQLETSNAVKGVSIGSSTIWGLNKSSFTHRIITIFFEELFISPLEFVGKEIGEGIRKMRGKKDGRLRIIEAYLFGSIAEGHPKPNSDIDVLVITGGGKGRESLRVELGEKIGLPLLEKTGNMASFHVYCQRNVKGGKPEWAREAIERGIKVI